VLKPMGLPAGRHLQRGMSIVELMVGVAIGLLIVAAATLMMSGQLSENRRLLVEAQLQQDLRAAADIMTREIRRTGAMIEPQSLQTVWFDGATLVQHNDIAASLAVGADHVDFAYMVDGPASMQGPFGYRLNGTVIQSRMGGAGWQDLTDANVVEVLSLTTTPRTSTAVRLPCANECPGGGSNCWPTVAVREIQVDITARAKRDTTVQRSLSTRARLRNDRLTFSNAGLDQMCPP
jgi:prepilin-type N-terminal cleavage/methylation domain-containing protein